jgi:hypothetical protein
MSLTFRRTNMLDSVAFNVLLQLEPDRVRKMLNNRITCDGSRLTTALLCEWDEWLIENTSGMIYGTAERNRDGSLKNVITWFEHETEMLAFMLRFSGEV